LSYARFFYYYTRRKNKVNEGGRKCQ